MFRLVFILPAALLIAGIFLYFKGETAGSPILLIEACLITVVFWLVFPRDYQVYNDHLRIVLGGPMSVQVAFQNIKSVKLTNKVGLTVNFASRITKYYVEIEKKKGASIAITPSDSEMFVKHANHAIQQWVKTRAIADLDR